MTRLRVLTVTLKWLLIVVAIGYLGGIAVLYFKQREFLFPIPQGGARPRKPPAFRKLKNMY